MEAGTVKGVVTISATIPGRNRAIHVSSGESYFGGDVIVGKMYAPSSGTLEIAGPLKTQGVYRNTLRLQGTALRRPTTHCFFTATVLYPFRPLLTGMRYG